MFICIWGDVRTLLAVTGTGEPVKTNEVMLLMYIGFGFAPAGRRSSGGRCPRRCRRTAAGGRTN
eukprot:5328031-Pyramimonas_sp.AAC.1